MRTQLFKKSPLVFCSLPGVKTSWGASGISFQDVSLCDLQQKFLQQGLQKSSPLMDCQRQSPRHISAGRLFAEFPRDWKKTTRRNRLLRVLQEIIYDCLEWEVGFIASQLLIWFSQPSWLKMTTVILSPSGELLRMKWIGLKSFSPPPKYPFPENSSKHLTPVRKTNSHTCLPYRIRKLQDASGICANFKAHGTFLNSVNQILGSWVQIMRWHNIGSHCGQRMAWSLQYYIDMGTWSLEWLHDTVSTRSHSVGQLIFCPLSKL